MEFKKTFYSDTFYSDGEKDFPAVYVRWDDAEEYLGERHTGDPVQDQKLVQGLLAAGAPDWVQDAPGWIDEKGWGVYQADAPTEVEPCPNCRGSRSYGPQQPHYDESIGVWVTYHGGWYPCPRCGGTGDKKDK